MPTPDSTPGNEEVIAALRRCWQPVASLAELERGPRRSLVLGEALAVFLGEDGRPYVVADRCPHRGASLAGGKVREDCIECPYHGWRWRGSDGRCAQIPSLPDQSRIPARAAVRRYPVAVRWGLVWTSLQEPAVELPRLDWFEEADWRWAHGEPFELPVSFGVMIENFRDVAHFAFVHRESLGAMPEVVEPLRPSREGMVVTMRRRMSGGPGGREFWGSLREIAYHAIAPNVIAARLWTDEGLRFIVHAARESRPGESIHYWLAGFEEGYSGAGLEEVLAAEAELYAEDVGVVSTVTPPELPLGEEGVSTLADVFTLAYREAFVEFVRGAITAPRRDR